MEELIPIASKLQDVLGALGQSTNLDLPQIVVIGGQSSGKSSVLESIVGRSFLPRGTGIVTRRPLVLQLFNTSGDNTNAPPYYFGNNNNISGDGGGDDRKEEHSYKNNDNTHNTHPDEEDNNDDNNAEWGEFLHKPGKRYYDFAQIRTEIVRDTDRLAGTGAMSKGVSANPIHLKIYSPKVLSLTMVDLPGLTKVAVQGQPEDIAEQILQINIQYGSNPNAILLAVTSANTDLASSDALKLARELDPRGDRTIGVLTKLDLMDPGTDVSEIMHNRVIPLRRGYIAVVNRGQRDIEADLSIQVGLRNEERYFRTHPVYSRDRSISGKCGTMNLARNLNGILIHHIRDCLPELKIRIANMMGDVQSELDALGMPEGYGPRDPSQMGGKLLALLSKFSANFAAMIDGRASNTNQHHDGMPSLRSNVVGGGVGHGGGNSGGGGTGGYGHGMGGVAIGMGSMNLGSSYHVSSSNNATIGSSADELYGGARISYIFHQVFSRSLNSVTAFDGLSEDEIRTTIGNANGTRPALFVPEISFDILVRRQIRRLEQPGVQCVDLVYDELQRIAAQSEPSELTRYPNLRDRMMDVVGSLLKRSVGPTQMWVSNLVRVELSYINTNHPDFIGGSRAVAKLMDKMAKEKEKAASAASVGVPNATNYTAKGIMTPVKERAGKEKDGDVGATPLSSSSLEKYMAADDGYSGSQNGAPPQHVVVDHGPPNNSGDTGGIMNFIFRNNNHTSSANSATGGTNGQNYRGGGLSHQGRSTGSQYGRPTGPPTIVQLPQVPDTMRQTDAPPSDREHVEMEIIKSLIDSYFCIVRKNYIDMVPKTIMYFLVNHVKDELQNELVSELYREAEIGFLMKEAEDIALRRKTCLEMKDLLEKALEIVNEVRDFNSFAK
ncbi:hypothetical protein ACHAXM_004087 [Skeletonema potamos]